MQRYLQKFAAAKTIFKCAARNTDLKTLILIVLIEIPVFVSALSRNRRNDPA